MQNIPFDRALVDEIIAKNKIKSVGAASIREVKKIIDDVEVATGEKFVRMEMGIPGIPAVQLGVDAEIEALEAKRAKYESIKQGMMQELLTGKTRLKGA